MDISPTARKSMLLSRETLDGIYFTSKHYKQAFEFATKRTVYYTVKAFTELVRYIFTFDGVKFFLSSHINQDPLECFFGCQRQRGKVNENPNVQAFCKNTQALRVIGNVCRNSVKGNCRGTVRNRESTSMREEDIAPLPKRRRKNM